MAAILSAEHLSKSYTLKKLLTDVTIYIGEHDRIGVVGVNGTGKSTLLKLLAGMEEPDGGVVMRKNGYMGEKTDMNRANEVRPMFRRLADVAERTGCAVILIGHLNKAAGGQSAYRGLGSIDFRAAARSVLLIGRVKREPNVRVIVHDKSSLAPEGKPVAFCLDPETGFSWIGEYDITADELLSGAGGNTATKTEQAEKLILDLLADGKELASEDIEKAAAEAGISARTVRAAKKNLDGRITSKRIGAAWYHALKK